MFLTKIKLRLLSSGFHIKSAGYSLSETGDEGICWSGDWQNLTGGHSDASQAHLTYRTKASVKGSRRCLHQKPSIRKYVLFSIRRIVSVVSFVRRRGFVGSGNFSWAPKRERLMAEPRIDFLRLPFTCLMVSENTFHRPKTNLSWQKMTANIKYRCIQSAR
jgi:hypothetical protein